MSHEIENNMVAGLKYDGNTQTILARSGIAAVVRNGVGDFSVQLEDPIGSGEEGTDCGIWLDGVAIGIITHSRVNATTFNVRTWTRPAGAPIDEAIWSFNVFRLKTGSN